MIDLCAICAQECGEVCVVSGAPKWGAPLCPLPARVWEQDGGNARGSTWLHDHGMKSVVQSFPAVMTGDEERLRGGKESPNVELAVQVVSPFFYLSPER